MEHRTISGVQGLPNLPLLCPSHSAEHCGTQGHQQCTTSSPLSWTHPFHAPAILPCATGHSTLGRAQGCASELTPSSPPPSGHVPWATGPPVAHRAKLSWSLLCTFHPFTALWDPPLPGSSITVNLRLPLLTSEPWGAMD